MALMLGVRPPKCKRILTDLWVVGIVETMNHPHPPPPSGVPINADALRHHRHLAGLTQIALAKKAGIHHVYISMIETGRRATIGPEAFARICDALNITDRTQLINTRTPGT